MSCKEVHKVSILDEYVKTAPSAQTALDIFRGEWLSILPPPLDQATGGASALFADLRLDWALRRIGGVQQRSILELGPLEGGHTYMLDGGGARSVVAIEANTRAYLKCLVVKEVLGIGSGRFLCGDFMEYLRARPERFDFCVAS